VVYDLTSHYLFITEPAAAVSEVDVTSMDIRVGVIMKVEKHPEADSLYGVCGAQPPWSHPLILL
jgi:hypothetical protein